MSITSEINRSDYVGTGLVTTYSYGFRIFDETHLLVTTRTAAGVEATLVLNTDYTVTGVDDAPGGSIVLTTALASGTELAIRRFLPLTQPTSIRNQGFFFPETHEDAFDRGVMLIQQQQDELNRSLKLPENETDIGELPSAADRASSFLAFDADGDPIASSGGFSSPPVSAFMDTVLDDANAATARATLGIPEADDVTIENAAGILQVKDSGIGDSKISDVDASKITGAITEFQIADQAVPPEKLTASVAGDGLSGGAGAALSVNVDGSTIEINSDSLRVKDGGITYAKLASDVTSKLSPKSIQRSTKTISFSAETGTKTGNTTISSVDTTKAYVILNGFEFAGADADMLTIGAKAQLTSATNVEVKASIAGAVSSTVDVIVYFTVVEWN